MANNEPVRKDVKISLKGCISHRNLVIESIIKSNYAILTKTGILCLFISLFNTSSHLNIDTTSW